MAMWAPDSWTDKPTRQQPTYPDPEKLASTVEQLAALPPLVTSWEVEGLKSQLAEAAAGELAGILGYEERPLVSVDYKDDPRSAIVDALSTLVIDDTQVKILAWYDNEWGYVNRMMELAVKVASSL